MITHKGSPFVKGKHFILEGENNVKLTYTGRAYKDYFVFLNESDNSEFILNEQEANNLKPFYLKESEPIILQEQENKDDLYQLVASYTDNQLSIMENAPSNKCFSELRKSFVEELEKLKENGIDYKVFTHKIDNADDRGYVQEMILDYLQYTQRNISEVSLPAHQAQLVNFIYTIDRMEGDK